LVDREIIEQDDVRASFQGFVELFERIDFYFDFH